MWNEDKTGVVKTKPTNQLHNVSPEIYHRAVTWVREIMVNSTGYFIDHALFSPDQNTWFFYENGFLVMRLSHDTMDAIYTKLTDTTTQIVQTFTPEEIERWR